MRYRVTVLVHEGHGQSHDEDTIDNAALIREFGVSAEHPRNAMLDLLDALKDVRPVYCIGEKVQLHPEPYAPSSGPDPRDADMPSPVCEVLAVDQHSENPDFIWGYEVRDVCTGEQMTVKPGKIRRRAPSSTETTGDRCPVCGSAPNVRCCEHGRDR